MSGEPTDMTGPEGAKVIADRRDELRRLSEARGMAGLTPYPTVEEIEEIVALEKLDKIAAHDYAMQLGVRMLEAAEDASAPPRATHNASVADDPFTVTEIDGVLVQVPVSDL